MSANVAWIRDFGEVETEEFAFLFCCTYICIHQFMRMREERGDRSNKAFNNNSSFSNMRCAQYAFAFCLSSFYSAKCQIPFPVLHCLVLHVVTITQIRMF